MPESMAVVCPEVAPPDRSLRPAGRPPEHLCAKPKLAGTARRVCALLILAAAVAAPARAQVERRDDEILQDVSSAVLGYPQFTIFDDVSAASDRGFVILFGKVTMGYKRTDIGRRVARVRGVKEVENRIEVLPSSPFDQSLRNSLARAIYGHSAFWQYASMPNPPIHIIVENGRVTLTGVVANEVERMLARTIALSSNAFSVTSNLKTDQEMKRRRIPYSAGSAGPSIFSRRISSRTGMPAKADGPPGGTIDTREPTITSLMT